MRRVSASPIYRNYPITYFEFQILKSLLLAVILIFDKVIYTSSYPTRNP